MKKKFKIVGIVVVVLLLAAYSVYTYLQPLAVETKTLSVAESEVTFMETGIVVNSGKKYVYPLVPGEVMEISVSEGDSVKAGEVLAILDSTAVDIEIMQLEKSVEGYEAQLEGAEVEYQNNVDTLKATRSNLYGQLKALEAGEKSEGQLDLEEQLIEQSKETYERGLEDLAKYEKLYNEGYISESEFKDFKSLVDSFEANYSQSLVASESTEDYYDGMKSSLYAQIDSINKTLEKDLLSSTKVYYEAMIEAARTGIDGARNMQEQFRIKSPVNGIVDEILMEDVNMVSGMEPVFVVQGEGKLEIEVKVNTRDIDVVNVGDEVELILDRRTGDVELAGKVTKISDSATVEISPLGVEERKVLVTIAPKEDGQMKEGYDVEVKFSVFRADDKIAVPNSALFKKDGEDMVLVIEGGKVVERQVVLGYELTGETIVDEGIDSGEVLIIDLDAKGLRVGINAASSNEEK